MYNSSINVEKDIRLVTLSTDLFYFEHPETSDIVQPGERLIEDKVYGSLLVETNYCHQLQLCDSFRVGSN